MRVLYDHQVFTAQKFGGISRYFFELMKHSNGLFEYDVSGVYSENVYMKQLGIYKEFPIKTGFKGKYRVVDFFNKLNSIKIIKQGDYDIIHPTYYGTYMLGKICSRQTDRKKKQDTLPWEENIAIHKNEVLTHKKQGYILFTGQRNGYKNFGKFAEAIAPLLIRYDLRLICTGQAFTKEEEAFLFKHKIGDRVTSKFVSDSELRDIYAKAILFAFPSLYEGFGIPILEAFSSGCPVVLSNASCFPEIAEDAAVYFDPNSIEDMREAIGRVLQDSSLQSTLAKKGHDRLASFSWEKTTRNTAQVYSSLLSLPDQNGKCLVVTVYDMIHELFPEAFSCKDKTASSKYLMMKNADKIIAISKNTKVDILKLYPEIDAEKIEVIHLGTSF